MIVEREYMVKVIFNHQEALALSIILGNLSRADHKEKGLDEEQCDAMDLLYEKLPKEDN
jgi:hypothetical protein